MTYDRDHIVWRIHDALRCNELPETMPDAYVEVDERHITLLGELSPSMANLYILQYQQGKVAEQALMESLFQSDSTHEGALASQTFRTEYRYWRLARDVFYSKLAREYPQSQFHTRKRLRILRGNRVALVNHDAYSAETIVSQQEDTATRH